MPPVSLPLNGGTQSACAGAPASSPHIATRHAAPILRIADSISPGATIECVGRRGKNGLRPEADLSARCCRVALDLAGASRHRPQRWMTGGFPMRNLFRSLKAPRFLKALGLGATLALLASGQAA